MICSIKDCSQESFVKDKRLCQTHYHKWYKYGSPYYQTKESGRNLCKSIGCDKFVVRMGYCKSCYSDDLDVMCWAYNCLSSNLKSRGLCSPHYHKWYKYGDPDVSVYFKRDGCCSVDGCENDVQGRGLCSKHRQRDLIYGDTGVNYRSNPVGAKKERNGYVEITLSKDDPFYCMTRKHGNSAPEHRIVMARHLGRPLTRNESVHHIDGNRKNNKLSNLQLRKRYHGPGQRYQCNDCGSIDVVAVEL